MNTTVLEQKTLTGPLQEVLHTGALAGTTAPKSRSVTMTLMFLIGCVTLMMTGFAVIIPVFPQRLQAFGLGSQMLALMEGAFGMGMFLFSTLMGTWSGRIGRKPILFISLAGFIVTNLLLAFVAVPLLFIPIRFVEGALLSGLMPVAMSMVGDTVPLEKQGRWIGFLTTAQAVGFALGPALGGFLSQSLGFTGPFLLSASIALLASLLAMFLVPETLSSRAPGQRKAMGATTAGQATQGRWTSAIWLVAPFLIIDFGMIFTFPFVFPQVPFFLEKVLHYSSASYGLIFSAYGLSLAIFPLILGRLSEKLPKQPLIVIGSLLFGSLVVVLLVAPLYPLLIVGAVLSGLGSAFVEPAMGSIYLATTSEENRGQIMGLRGSAISLAVMLGPLVQALASLWITAQTTFAIGMLISLGMALVAFLLLRQARKAK